MRCSHHAPGEAEAWGKQSSLIGDWQEVDGLVQFPQLPVPYREGKWPRAVWRGPTKGFKFGLVSARWLAEPSVE